jgi:Ca2+/H+ antiporter
MSVIINLLVCIGVLKHSSLDAFKPFMLRLSTPLPCAPRFALRDKLDLAVSITAGSSLQIALLVLPLMVIIGWIMGNNNMSLSFDGFQVAVMFIDVSTSLEVGSRM